MSAEASRIPVFVVCDGTTHAEAMLADADQQLVAARNTLREAAIAYGACTDLAATIEAAATALDGAAIMFGAVFSYRKLVASLVAAKRNTASVEVV